jgi:hypothetical protein
VLGIYDMTGELMRFAITAMATSGELPSSEPESKASKDGNPAALKAAKSEEGDAMEVDAAAAGTATSNRNILTDLRQLRSALESLNTSGTGPFGKEADKKAEVMRQSVEGRTGSVRPDRARGGEAEGVDAGLERESGGGG